MSNKIFCASLNGTDTKIVQIESALRRGLPSFSITGLANNSIQEAKQRIQAALFAIGYTLKAEKITINLSPSDLPKSGSYFDLPIALSLYADTAQDFENLDSQNSLDSQILDSQNALDSENSQFQNLDSENPAQKHEIFAFGELGLDGEVKYTAQIYPLLFDLALLRPNAIVIAPKNAQNLLQFIPNLRFIFVQNLAKAIEILNTPNGIKLAQDSQNLDSEILQFQSIEAGGEKYYFLKNFELNFAQVLGQGDEKFGAVRAALIAAAGFHNIIFEGSPGCGKSMIAKRMRFILPPMNLGEMLSVVKLNSLQDSQNAYTPLRPFRSPHASASKAAILGSATNTQPKPGEIALANHGILFFDELPHFKRDVLESLREPLENNRFSVSRVGSKLDYETSFLFIGAQNPCPCGNLLSQVKECRCGDKEISAYKNRLSEPFWDRIDMFVQMAEFDTNESAKSAVDSQKLQDLVLQAFRFCKSRAQGAFNGKLNEREIEKFCVLNPQAQEVFTQAITRFNLSARAQNKVKKVARTIADLALSQEIQKSHILEALSYRRL